MAHSYITTGTTVQVSGPCRKAKVQVNAALTGTITVIDGDGTNNTTIAVITNPTVGSQFEYFNFSVGVRVTTSTTCDVTVNTDGSYGSNN